MSHSLSGFLENTPREREGGGLVSLAIICAAPSKGVRYKRGEKEGRKELIASSSCSIPVGKILYQIKGKGERRKKREGYSFYRSGQGCQ